VDESVEAALGLIAATPGVFRAALLRLPAEISEASDPRGEWGPRDLVAHLIDVEEIVFMSRIRRVIEEDRPFIQSIDPPERLEGSGYLAKPLAELLDELAARRERDVAWLRGLDRAALLRVGVHDVAGEVTAGNFLHYWASHDLTHIRQLATMLRTAMEPHIGPMKLFYEEV
jgi:uncharacterized damage-inducible protein DinB